MSTSANKRVLILGGGHAGFHAAKRLLKLRKPDDHLEIVLVNSDNAEVYHGLMPQIVGGKIEPRHALVALRHILPEVKLYACEVERIDLEGRQVFLNPGEERQRIALSYDYLIISLGSVTDLSRFPGLLEHGLQTKTIGDVFHLRDHIIEMLERASVQENREERCRLLTFVIAGAGFAGVEIGSEANQLVRSALRFYPSINRQEIRFLLINTSDRILPAVTEGMARRAARYLERTGVEVRHGQSIAGATSSAALLSTGERIPTKTLIVTVGVKPNPVVTSLPFVFDQDRIKTDRFCRVPGHPGVYALGDNAAIPHPKTGEACPPTFIYALTHGTCAGDNIIAEHRAKSPRPFTFTAFGDLAMLSNTWAVVDFFGVPLSGFLASLFWRLIFLAAIPSWLRRWTILFDWFASTALPTDIAQLTVSRSDSIIPLRFGAGEVVIRQGEPGSRFYIINEGEVEVVRSLGTGQEVHLARLGPGQYFGEVALLNDVTRTATVRALVDTKLLSIARQDFSTLVKYLPGLRTTVTETARTAISATKADLGNPL